MIKINDKTFYLASGEICCILKVENDRLRHVYFGKRVEPEDDLSALGQETDELVFGAGDKPTDRFVFESAEECEEKNIPVAPSLRGGKTLKITLRSARAKAELFYTPYVRGGFTRAAIITNESDMPLTFTPELQAATVFGDGKVYSLADLCRGRKSDAAGAKKDVKNFSAVVSADCGEEYGIARGFLCVYGNGEIVERQSDGCTRIFERAREVTLKPREKYYAPEVLAVYSDRGLGGMSRAFHDILRENLGGNVNARRPVVLFAPDGVADSARESVTATTELGCEVFAVDGSALSSSQLKDLSAECKSAGVKFGIKIALEGICKDSALFGEYCAKRRNGNGYSIDITNGRAFATFIDRVRSVIADCGIEYIMVDVKRGGIGYGEAQELCNAVSAQFAELITEFGAAGPQTSYANTLCYPPCVMRNIVGEHPARSFKTRFDEATFGILGYAFDPCAVSEQTRRAVRAQVFSYQDDEPLVMNGDLYRIELPDGGRCMITVSKDKSQAYAVCERVGGKSEYVMFAGLDEHNIYHIRELDKCFSGTALKYCGIALPPAGDDMTTYTFHLNQVADFD